MLYPQGLSPKHPLGLAKLIAPHRVAQKTFVANITTQVIERHIVRGIERIFFPVVVNGLTDSKAEAIAMEPAAARRQKKLIDDSGNINACRSILKRCQAACHRDSYLASCTCPSSFGG